MDGSIGSMDSFSQEWLLYIFQIISVQCCLQYCLTVYVVFKKTESFRNSGGFKY